MSTTYKPFTPIEGLATNSNGELTILAQHVSQTADSIAFALETLMLATFSSGGVVTAGTVSVSGSSIQVQNRRGILLSALMSADCLDQTLDLSSIATGEKVTVYVEPSAGEVVQLAFADAETQENISHNLMQYLGRLTSATDPGSHPDYPQDSVPVGKYTKTAAGLTQDELYSTAPVTR